MKIFSNTSIISRLNLLRLLFVIWLILQVLKSSQLGLTHFWELLFVNSLIDCINLLLQKLWIWPLILNRLRLILRISLVNWISFISPSLNILIHIQGGLNQLSRRRSSSLLWRMSLNKYRLMTPSDFRDIWLGE